MVFPAVWAAAMVGPPANVHAATIIAIAASIGIPARLRRRIPGHLPFCVSEACLAQRERGWKPIWRRQIAGNNPPYCSTRFGDQAARETRAAAEATSSVMTENFVNSTGPKL